MMNQQTTMSEDTFSTAASAVDETVSQTAIIKHFLNPLQVWSESQETEVGYKPPIGRLFQSVFSFPSAITMRLFYKIVPDLALSKTIVIGLKKYNQVLSFFLSIPERVAG